MTPRRVALQAMAALPDEALVPVGWVRSWLDEAESEAPELNDFTVQEVAEQVGRRPSTIRGWLSAGKIDGAYRLEGRDWRVPRTALRRFLDNQGRDSAPVTPHRGHQALSEWRKHVA